MPDVFPDKWLGELPDIRFVNPAMSRAIRAGAFSMQLAEGQFPRSDFNPILSAALSGKKAILLSWTFEYYANFQVYWKSSVPAGQEYALLATTNGYSYTTGDLEPSKTYFFYVKANVGDYFYYSNVVELFVSCGKGIILSADPPNRPAAQVPHGDGYACTATLGDNGDIFKHVAGVGDFISLGQAARSWYGITVAKNGNVYASDNAGKIYKQTNGLGDFNFFQNMAFAGAMTSAPNGDSYCIEQENSGPIWKSPGGGLFAPITGTGGVPWAGICAAPNGDIYASSSDSAHTGDIYKQTGGVGAFNALGQVNRHWRGMVATPYGDIYAAVGTVGGTGGTGIYKQSFGVGDFVRIDSNIREWYSMSASPNRNVYCAVLAGDIYVQVRGAGPFIALNQTSRPWYGLAIKQY